MEDLGFKEYIKDFVLDHNHVQARCLITSPGLYFCYYAKFVSETDSEIEITYNCLTVNTVSAVVYPGKYFLSIVTSGNNFSDHYMYVKKVIKAKETLKRFVNDYVIPYLYRPITGRSFKRLQEILEHGRGQDL